MSQFPPGSVTASAPFIAALAAMIAILLGVRMLEELAATMCTQQHRHINIHLQLGTGYSEYLEWRPSCILLIVSSPVSCPNFKFQHTPVLPCLPKKRQHIDTVWLWPDWARQGSAPATSIIFPMISLHPNERFQTEFALNSFFLNHNMAIQNLQKFQKIRNKMAVGNHNQGEIATKETIAMSMFLGHQCIVPSKQASPSPWENKCLAELWLDASEIITNMFRCLKWRYSPM